MTQPALPTNPTAGHPDPILQSDVTCKRCGCLDVPQYEGELQICPHCGAVLDPTPPEPVSWLAQWPADKRSGLAELFYRAVRSGETDLTAIVDHVVTTLHRRLQWSTAPEQRQLFSQVLNTLTDDPKAAQAYAAEVLAIEALPPEEKASRKHEKAKPFVLESMRGKEATQKQHWLLRSLGHTGALPADRAEASELIERLMRAKGRS